MDIFRDVGSSISSALVTKLVFSSFFSVVGFVLLGNIGRGRWEFKSSEVRERIIDA